MKREGRREGEQGGEGARAQGGVMPGLRRLTFQSCGGEGEYEREKLKL